MKKRKLDLKSLELDTSLEILDLKELQISIKGGSTSNDCVFNCFNYFDGNSYDYSQYYYNTFYNLGYTPESNGGGVNTTDISTIGGYGNMNVGLLSTTADGSVAPNGTVSGGTYNGYSVMMTFSGANGADHAVVVTGTSLINGSKVVNYYDPTTGLYSYRQDNDYSGLYAVGAVGTGSYNGPSYGGGS